MKRYYTADTHLGHARIIELCGRPFSNVEEMNQTIVDNFNAVATNEDEIYVLGDAALGKLDDSLPWFKKINAKLILIPGNHDRPSRAYQRKGDVRAKIEKERERYLEYFDAVYLESETGASGFFAPFSSSDRVVLMSHYPYDGDSHGEDRHSDLRPQAVGGYRHPLIHGHVHNEWRQKGAQFNVGVDVNDFQLVSEEEIIEWVATI
jgi:calcineurin-like phosphoesterase family protein